MGVHSRVRGFTLLEVIVVLAIFVGIAGVVVPLMRAEIHDSKLTRALDDTGRIAAAVSRACGPALAVPGTTDASAPPCSLLTSGRTPGGLPLGRRLRLVEFLESAAADGATARMPHLGEPGADPWGRSYAVVVPEKGARGHAWALSAGPDGILQTNETSEALLGDDVGVCLR